MWELFTIRGPNIDPKHQGSYSEDTQGENPQSMETATSERLRSSSAWTCPPSPKSTVTSCAVAMKLGRRRWWETRRLAVHVGNSFAARFSLFLDPLLGVKALGMCHWYPILAP